MQVTLAGLDQLMASAGAIKTWLADCASLIAKGMTAAELEKHRKREGKQRAPPAAATGDPLADVHAASPSDSVLEENAASALSASQPVATEEGEEPVEILTDMPGQHVSWTTPMGLPAMQPYTVTVRPVLLSLTRLQTLAAGIEVHLCLPRLLWRTV